jgi:hypothetical protein
MNKIYALAICLLATASYAQTTTGLVNLTSNMTYQLDLNEANSIATLTLSGPSDRWFALTIGSFSGGGAMESGNDVVYWNGTSLVDASQNGQSSPLNDASNNWTQVSITPNTPSAGRVTLVYTRAFNTGDNSDYPFNTTDASIDFAWARGNSASFTFSYHGSSNRGYDLDRSLTGATNVLQESEGSNAAIQIYPNPTNGNITVESTLIRGNKERIEVRDARGEVVLSAVPLSSQTKLSLNELPQGIYWLQLIDNNVLVGTKRLIKQ